MPCPPSYEEQRFVSLDIESDELNRMVVQQFAELPDTRTLLHRFLAAFPTIAESQRLQALDSKIEQVLLNRDEVQLSINFPATWPTMEDVERYEAFTEALRRVNYSLESTLCETRTLLYSGARQRLAQSSLWEEPGFQQIWASEMDRHALHRELDRKWKLLPLQKSLQHYQARLLQNLSPTQMESAKAYVLDYQGQILAIEAIPIEDLMADRCLL